MIRKAAKIEDGKVTNVIVIDDTTPKEFYDIELEAGSEVSVGYTYEDGEFTSPEPLPDENVES